MGVVKKRLALIRSPADKSYHQRWYLVFMSHPQMARCWSSPRSSMACHCQQCSLHF